MSTPKENLVCGGGVSFGMKKIIGGRVLQILKNLLTSKGDTDKFFVGQGEYCGEI